jgi:hypothetical protein
MLHVVPDYCKKKHIEKLHGAFLAIRVSNAGNSIVMLLADFKNVKLICIIQ